MTTPRLIGLRLYNVTLGRTAFGSRILRKGLVRLLIMRRPKSEAYMASSRFFLFSELDDPGT